MKLIPAITLPFARSGETSIYCATFQMAWDQLLKDLGVGYALPAIGINSMMGALNSNSGFDLESFDEEEYIAKAGVLPGVVYKIYAEMLKKFGKIVVELPEGGDRLAFAYLLKLLKFPFTFTFTRYDDPTSALCFKGNRVESFGANTFTKNTISFYKSSMRPCVRVEIDLGNDLICFTKADFPIYNVQELQAEIANLVCDENKVPLISIGRVRIPILQLETLQSFEELCGPLLSPAGASISMALQYVKFGLDEKGVSLESYAIIGYSGSLGISVIPVDFLFDSTFFIEMISKKTRSTYFVAHIDSTEGMFML